jgi:hypothetical protein
LSILINKKHQAKAMKTIEDISSCPFWTKEGVSKISYRGYDGWLPAEREARKPKEGYNKVKCDFYIQEFGNCKLQFFFPRRDSIDHNPCVFAEW